MGKKVILFILFFFSLTFIAPKQETYAEKHSAQSASLLKAQETPGYDNRVLILEQYLEKWDSPLASNAGKFVEEADKYNLDWKFVASIAGLESSFGKFLPYNSYNAWGWGIYGTNVHYFKSYDEGIATISKGLRENYIDKWGAKDIYEIGSLYAASPTWAERVIGFMNSIDTFEKEMETKTLPISL